MNGTLPGFGTSAGSRLHAGATALVLCATVWTTTVAPAVDVDSASHFSDYPTSVGASTPAKATDRERVKQLYARSGLTWDQLAKSFGVSRRAVHHWATGGKLSSANAATLTELSAFIKARPDLTPTQIRKAFFEPDHGGRSIMDRLRIKHASSASGDVSGSHLRPEQLAGALNESL